MEPNEHEYPESEVPEAMAQQLKTITTYVTWLQELKDKVTADGLSRHDISALNAIRDSLIEVGVEFEPVPALEQYGSGSFTDERSSVNLDVGLEGIGQTIVQTLKRWIKKLIDYIRSVVRWFRKNFHNEDKMQDHLTKFQRGIDRTHKGSEDLAAKYVKVDDREFMKKLVEQWKKIIDDSKMQYTRENLSVLGNAGAVDEVKQVIERTDNLSEALRAMTFQFSQFFLKPDTAQDQFTADFQIFSGIHDQKIATEQLVMVRPGKNLKQHHDARDSYFNNLTASGGFRHPKRLTTVTKYEHLFKTMEYTADVMRKIEREVDVVTTDTDDVVKILNGFSQAVDDLNHIGTFLVNYNKTKLKMLKMIADYENYRFTLLFRQAKDNVVNDYQHQMLDRIRKDIEKFLRGIMQ